MSKVRVFTLLALMSLTGVASAQVSQPNPQLSASSSQKWEYATLYQFRSGTIGIYSIRLPDGYFSGDSMEELFQKAVGRPINKNEAGLYVIMNWFGERGWELTGINADSSSTAYWFKRPAKKTP